MYIETTCQELLADTAAVTEINLNRCVGKINTIKQLYMYKLRFTFFPYLLLKYLPYS